MGEIPSNNYLIIDIQSSENTPRANIREWLPRISKEYKKKWAELLHYNANY